MREIAAQRKHQGGATLVMVAAGLGVLLGMSALSIDLTAMYVTRNEAQRAADAGALAGATVFVDVGCTVASGGCVKGGPQEAPARQQAIAAASQNPVGGQAPTAGNPSADPPIIPTVEVDFSYPTPEEPQITVTVHRDTAHGNAMATYFAKALGISAVDISASAKAEAFNPTGSDIPIGVQCLRPFLVPNCDPVHADPADPANLNPACDTTAGYFIDPTTRAIVHPGDYEPSNPKTSGVFGMPWTLHTDAGPSEWYLIKFEPSSSGSDLRTYISTCAPKTISCGSKLDTLVGAKAGPVAQGVNELIHADKACLSGQDTICAPDPSSNLAPSGASCATRPFPITGGTNNPILGVRGKVYAGPSDSVITAAIYDGSDLGSGGTNIAILGYMQLFITRTIGDKGSPCTGVGKDVEVVILNISTCGASSGSSGSGPPITSAGSPIPIRLIR